MHPERTSSRQFASRGAGRTGRITPTGEERRKPEKTLGGEQVEGRQAVRELLIAGKRKVREVWVATDLLDGESASDIVTDIVEIARSVRAPVQEVNRKRLEATARSEAPQGVIAFAAPLLETDLAELIKRRPGARRSSSLSTASPTPATSARMLRCCDGAGVDGVVMPRHRAVHVTPTVAKAAAGAVEHVPMALVGGLPAALARIKDAGIWVIGLDDGADRGSVRHRRSGGRRGVPRAGRRGCRSVAAGARALRPDRQHPDARSPEFAERQRRRCTGDLRDRSPAPQTLNRRDAGRLGRRQCRPAPWSIGGTSSPSGITDVSIGISTGTANVVVVDEVVVGVSGCSRQVTLVISCCSKLNVDVLRFPPN